MRTPRSTASLLLVLSMLATVLLSIPTARAQSNDGGERGVRDALIDEGLVELDAIEAGALLFQSDQPGWYVPAPALQSDIDVSVSGPVARTTVTQRFQNVASVFVEGTYVFPLPEGAAVDTLRMRVGDRWIEGAVEERTQAREIFEQAAAEGRVATLVEQQRPNVFTTEVANIAPNAVVIVQIEFQQTLAPRSGVYGLRIPLVVAPRYVPASQHNHRFTLGPEGWTRVTSIDEDAAAVATPLADPDAAPATVRNPVSITVDLDAGFPLAAIESLSHDVLVDRPADSAGTTAEIRLAGPVPADRDFYLSWNPSALDEPHGSVFSESHGQDAHHLLILAPPEIDAIAAEVAPREVIFVQDTSGSMAGDSMAQARAGLTAALSRLREVDTFNIIEFDTDFNKFSASPVAASPGNLARAQAFVDNLIASDGTEMYAPLAAALADVTPDDGRLRQVVFLTDGAVSNELELLELIDEQLGDTRLFTVGIGAAPNSYFMTAAARAGRGTTTFIGNIVEVGQTMTELFERLQSPAVVDIEFEGLPAGAEVSPSPVPDLYAGDPVVVTLRVPAEAEIDAIVLTGQQGRADWRLDVPLDLTVDRPGISKLWARDHVRDLEAQWSSARVTEDDRVRIDAEILATALDFGLVSRLTSLVAVDVEVTRPADEDAADTTVDLNLPDGWDPDAFATPETTATDDGSDAVTNAALERLEAAAEMTWVGEGTPLPETAHNWQIRAAIGLALAATGAAGLRRRR